MGLNEVWAARYISGEGWKSAARVRIAILAGTLAYIVPVSAFACLCGAGNTPWREPTLAATGAVTARVPNNA